MHRRTAMRLRALRAVYYLLHLLSPIFCHMRKKFETGGIKAALLSRVDVSSLRWSLIAEHFVKPIQDHPQESAINVAASKQGGQAKLNKIFSADLIIIVVCLLSVALICKGQSAIKTSLN